MNKITIMLVDIDEKYLMPIELRLIEMLGDKVELSVISDEAYLKKYFSLPRQIDILVIKESLYSTDFQRHNINKTFILSEDMYCNETTQSLNVHTIYKYTSVKEIYSEIINKSSMEPGNKKNESKVIMVYSPSGGVGKTTISLGLSSALKLAYKKVLYINTETIQGFHFMFKNIEYSQVGFENYMVNADENILTHLNKALGNEGFDYLLPFKQSLSSLNLGLNEFRFLIDKIKKSGMYDYIIVDTSNEFTNEKSMLMGYCDKVIILTTQSKIDAVNINALKYNIDSSNQNKFIFICNKYKETEENYLIKDDFVKGCNISEYIGYIDTEIKSLNNITNNRAFSKLAYMLS